MTITLFRPAISLLLPGRGVRLGRGGPFRLWSRLSRYRSLTLKRHRLLFPGRYHSLFARRQGGIFRRCQGLLPGSYEGVLTNPRGSPRRRRWGLLVPDDKVPQHVFGEVEVPL